MRGEMQKGFSGGLNSESSPFASLFEHHICVLQLAR